MNILNFLVSLLTILAVLSSVFYIFLHFVKARNKALKIGGKHLDTMKTGSDVQNENGQTFMPSRGA